MLTLGLLPAGVSLVLLTSLECAIGVGLISGRFMRLTLLLLAFQMIGAATPLLLFPDEAFTQWPYAPTLEGQYIIKNLVLASAGVLIGPPSAAASSPPTLPLPHGGGRSGTRPRYERL